MAHYFTESLICELREYINIRSLLNTSRTLASYKEKYAYYNLTRSKSLYYYANPSFMDGKILHPHLQLGLSFDARHIDYDINKFSHVHSLRLTSIDFLPGSVNLPTLHTISRLSVHNCRMNNYVEEFDNCKELYIQNCYDKDRVFINLYHRTGSCLTLHL